MSSIAPMGNEHDILDDEGAAFYLGVTKRTIRAWREREGLPHFKITNKVIRFRRSDLDAWLMKRRVAMAEA